MKNRYVRLQHRSVRKIKKWRWNSKRPITYCDIALVRYTIKTSKPPNLNLIFINDYRKIKLKEAVRFVLKNKLDLNNRDELNLVNIIIKDKPVYVCQLFMIVFCVNLSWHYHNVIEFIAFFFLLSEWLLLSYFISVIIKFIAFLS